MKVKQQPEDFQVEELTDVRPGAGPFALYRLEKTGWSTPDAVAAVRQRWRLDLQRVSYGGLKDRHARTVQYLTIYRGPQRQLHHQEVALHYLGQVAEPYTSRDIRANRFQLTLRDIAAEALPAARQALEELAREGVPSYFDDQRFGSVVAGGEFVARELVRGRFEEALRLALVSPYEHDRGPQKREKDLLRSSWGDWPTLAQRLSHGPTRGIIEHLARRPDDFRGALTRLRPDLRCLYLSAYQSHLWNRMLALWLRQHCRPEQLLAAPLRLGELPMHHGLDAEQLAALAALQLPLPSARLKIAPDDPRAPLVDAVLAEEGLQLRELQVKHFREMFFSKGERAGLCLPTGMTHESGPDEHHPGTHKLALAFDLPRGCYATLVVKRIQVAL